MKYYLLFSLITLSLSGCSQSSMEERIVNYIEDNCKEDSCFIDIKNITDFSWDTMYCFNYTDSDEEISKIVGIPFKSQREFTKKLIFIYRNKIVYFEERTVDIEGPKKDEVLFGRSDEPMKYKSYSSPNAVFKVLKVGGRSGSYYEFVKQ